MIFYTLKKMRFVLALILVASAPVVSAMPIVIDLNNFFADPTVSVAPDGSSATIAEDQFQTPVILSNDPFFGDPEVIVPTATNSILEFDYNFMEDTDSDDAFEAFVIDPNTGTALAGFEFSTMMSGSGTVGFDLSSLIGTMGLGFQFQLVALAGDAGLLSTVTINDLRLVSADPGPGPDPMPTPVSEPSTMALLLASFLLLARRRQAK